MNCIARICANSLLLSFSLQVFFHGFHTNFVIVCSNLHLEESLHATHILLLQLLQFLRLKFLIFNSLHELAYVVLFGAEIYLVILLILSNIGLFALSILN